MSKLFNRQPATGLMAQISIGGLPIYGDDLQMMQDNSTQLYGNPLIKGFNCIVSGCLVDELNVDTKTIKVTPGVILLGDIAYRFTGYEGTYPFSIIPGNEVIDTRQFRDGTLQDVAIDYNYTTRTNFTFDTPSTQSLSSLIPTNLGANEIYFDPFSYQRADNILRNLGLGAGEVLNTPISNITKTETGKSIIGGPLGATYGRGAEGRWKWVGFRNISRSGGFSLRGDSDNVGQFRGRDTIRLDQNQLPRHSHDVSSRMTIDDESPYGFARAWSQNALNQFIGVGGGGNRTVSTNPDSTVGTNNAGDTEVDVKEVYKDTRDFRIAGTSSEVGDGRGIDITNRSYCVNMFQWQGLDRAQSIIPCLFNPNIARHAVPFTNM